MNPMVVFGSKAENTHGGRHGNRLGSQEFFHGVVRALHTELSLRIRVNQPSHTFGGTDNTPFPCTRDFQELRLEFSRKEIIQGRELGQAGFQGILLRTLARFAKIYLVVFCIGYLITELSALSKLSTISSCNRVRDHVMGKSLGMDS
jgi:hypothetical protein